MDASARYELAKRIEWDALVNDLLDGDLTKLSFTDQALVEQYSDQPDVKARAIELSIPAPQLALLKLALLVEGENISAERFARRILDGKDPELGLELN